ncbi:MAG TPA: hypothetical protein VK196_16310 [Magnetospirillum sp.]|nr:hypothetical protein [Magnetospirillum sp.]
MVDLNLKGISFDRGIDRVIPSGELQQGHLPTEGRLSPSDGRATPRLDQILAMPDLADNLARELAPRLDDLALLLPDRFLRALSSTRDMLTDEKRNHPEHQSLFREAEKVLGEESGLRELLDMYRSALFKG